MKKILINANILPGSVESAGEGSAIYKNATMPVLENQAIVIEGAKIRRILPMAELTEAAKQDAEVLDLEGRYVMPGLINMHVHLPGSGKPAKKKKDMNKMVKILLSNGLTRAVARKMCENYAKTALMAGTTTIRTVGGLGNLDSVIRDRVRSGKVVGPRIVACNTAIGPEGGHMVGTVAAAAATEEECIAAVQRLHAEGADWIKLMITGGVLDAVRKGEPGVLKMDPALVRVCCDEAHRLGHKVCAHVESPIGVKVAVENGVDSIEHGATMEEGVVEQLKENGGCYICTLSPTLPFQSLSAEELGLNEDAKYNGVVLLNGIASGAKQALEAGIPVGLGTDTACPFITHYDMWRELPSYVKYCGVSPAFALHSATAINASILGMDDRIGYVKEGYIADLLVAESNPLATEQGNFRALRQPYMVVTGGKVIENPKIDFIPEVDEKIDWV